MISKFTFRPVSSVYERYSKEVKGIKSFIIVRHPFNRLVSAFRDKIERYHTPELKDDFYYKVYGGPIVGRFRKAALRRFGSDFFSEANHFGAPVPVSNGRRNAKLPSFWEFVQYVKACRVSRMDEHFRPIYDFCSPCDINYETVIHFENLSEESKYLKGVLDPFGATAEAQIEWANPNLTGLKLDDLTTLYFQTLSSEDIIALYKIYELDMKMFGYSFHLKNITLPQP
ncbi:hypothetical protein TCAL_13639 [Tigriopus californicus]|uniref:Carbohydrate sulfotransferase n=2 Tax=Tigriopus californicus TaxID=6832 RepID=A0A553PFR6_TIGCA|nr:hypothetical protein TCAL_13639 [Tigriopus californicus]|eukprot:TCALIF_13639-PA protein Name:"Similar to Chst11 Carbohydrate sulfotransferase 11 (Mus musculus)" AED:0.04 eAED:0.04 QI:0/-1/0/1/-1/1/1/0/227